MSKISLLLFIVVLAVTCISADQGVLNALIEAYQSVVTECSQSHGVSTDQIKGAIDSANPEGIDSCFGGCVLKKVDVINNEGKYDAAVGLSQLKKYVKDDKKFKQIENVANQCASVNDEPVTDGETGCQRAKLLMECMLKNKEQLPL